MSIGEGIFWGACVLGVVALVLGTKDRWSWKKIAARGVLFSVGAVALVAAGIYVANWYRDRPQVVTSYWDISLGASPADVRFLKGEPARATAEERWYYRESDDVAVVVDFTKGKVSSVLAFGTRGSLPNVGNISVYVSMDELVKRYGPPSAITTSDDGLIRTLNFRDYNAVVSFDKDGMVGGGVVADLSRPRSYGKAASSASSSASSPGLQAPRSDAADGGVKR